MTTTDLDVVPATNNRAPVSIDPDDMARMLFQARGLMHDTGKVPGRNRLMDLLRVGPDKANAVRAVLLANNPTMPQSGGGYGELSPTGAYPQVTPATSPPGEVETKTPAKRVRSWPLLIIAAPAFVAVWSGWVGLGGMTGFGIIHPLPGIADRVQLNTAITLPIGVEVYAAYAIHVLLAPGVSARARKFAGWSSALALVIGMAGQIAYHLLAASGVVSAPWEVTVFVASLPVIVVFAGVMLAHLVRDGYEAGS